MFRLALASTPLLDDGRHDAETYRGHQGDEVKVQAERGTKAALSPREALVYVMVTVAAADRTIGEIELTRMHSMVRELPAFHGLDEDWFGREALDCGKILAKPDGVTKVVRLIADALSGELRETAYALAAEVAVSDLAMKDDERQFLALLAERLQLDDLICAALQRCALVRHFRI
jgi:uncharacterized membrane protein YebE (DUF533 family)